ncbi:hypothetical protein DFH07DRAFT_1056754 [Mycena maculata]|uniref:Uncharacterized protein n=1 Tax=Mycena maculata TaxID=230809 RepID=A0AAD7K0Z9_9AGAR|nr:hypothetical protein DFH07DRAFT_1056754 [Mycena maculata]
MRSCLLQLSRRSLTMANFGYLRPSSKLSSPSLLANQKTYRQPVSPHTTIANHMREAVFKNWYTTPNIPRPWSCDWAIWSATDLWVPDGGSLPVEEEFNEPFGLSAPLEPLIFYDPNGDGDTSEDFLFAFACGGQYYLYGDGRDAVRRCHGRYPSPTEFLCTEMGSFGTPERNSARHDQLMVRCVRWRQDHDPASPTDDADWQRLNQEMDMEWINPPPNDRYTEIFRAEDKCEIMAGKRVT